MDSNSLVFSDGSFSGNNDGSSQFGFIIFLADKNNDVSLIGFSSVLSRRVVRPVLGAETFSLAYACDAATVMQHKLKNILGRRLKIKILADSETLFNFIIRDASTTERRLMIHVKAVREAYNDVTVEDDIWIRRNYNLADVVTKTSLLPLFNKVMKTGTNMKSSNL